MIPIKSMTEKEIAGAAEAFADYTYADGEHGLIYLLDDDSLQMVALIHNLIYIKGQHGFFRTTQKTATLP